MTTASPHSAKTLTPANGAIALGSHDGGRLLVWACAGIFFAVTTAVSWSRWANFQYRTFDLAYYVQAVWQLIHGRFEVTVEHVPLLGNHVEPIVFLFAPIFAVFRHPMVFVVVQNAAIALMAPVGYRIARQFFERWTAALLATALLLAPAAWYVALHEFHPEALTAPLLLLMVYSRIVRRLWLHWLCFIGVLACKENMALLLGVYCVVFLIIERRSPRADLFRWFAAPLLVAAVWFVVCAKVITPTLNSGSIDYLSLYNRLGTSPAEILWNLVARPQLAGNTLWHALTHGNLLWALLLPFLLLPLLRPRWLIISAPILLQHLLSWRSSEWTIYFHYAAPLIPLFWLGAVESLVSLRAPFELEKRAPTGSAQSASHADTETSLAIETDSPWVPLIALLMVVACISAQAWLGPATAIVSELSDQPARAADRARKQNFIARIPATASVVAPLPYLSHLAMREKLYSLHYILKGLKTLSRERYEPPPAPDFVLIDYADTATFDASAGYYHPQMRTVYGAIVPSSDQLLHDFLATATWRAESVSELTLLQKQDGAQRH